MSPLEYFHKIQELKLSNLNERQFLNFKNYKGIVVINGYQINLIIKLISVYRV